ncbi:hypothetical protein SBC2_08660 [Caballeronia sp. SBC2]|nr:hypothetical protein SBC2_08660 [Caballeronia sp. SBC2]
MASIQSVLVGLAARCATHFELQAERIYFCLHASRSLKEPTDLIPVRIAQITVRLAELVKFTEGNLQIDLVFCSHLVTFDFSLSTTVARQEMRAFEQDPIIHISLLDVQERQGKNVPNRSHAKAHRISKNESKSLSWHLDRNFTTFPSSSRLRRCVLPILRWRCRVLLVSLQAVLGTILAIFRSHGFLFSKWDGIRQRQSIAPHVLGHAGRHNFLDLRLRHRRQSPTEGFEVLWPYQNSSFCK